MTENETPVTEKPEARAKGARTGPTTKTPAAPKPKAGAKKTVAKLKTTAAGEASAEQLKRADLAIKAIEKFSQQKPIGFNDHPLPCVSTGAINLDHIIGGVIAPDKSGPLCPGYPRGRITEIYGAEASGKTTLTLEAIVEVQRRGGSAMFLDFEHALSHKYARDLGVNFDPRRLMLYQPDDMEQGLDMLRLGVYAGVDLIVIDSVAAMVPRAEMKKNFEDSSKIGVLALTLSLALPKIVKSLKPTERNPLGTALILINQPRALISTGPTRGGPSESTAGGKALKFYAYLRLQTICLRTEKIVTRDPITKKEKKIPFGTHTQVRVIKSKVDAKGGQSTDIFIRYGQGIDDLYTMIESGVAHRIIKKTGSFFELGEQKFQGREKLRQFLLSNKTALDELQAAVLTAIRSEAVDDPNVEMSEDDEVDAAIASTLGSDDEFEESGEAEDVDLEEEV